MKIEEGKKYVDRDGAVVGPMRNFERGGIYPWRSPGNMSYTPAGRYIQGDTSQFDLVKEYVEPGEEFEDMSSRARAYRAIDSERAYQNAQIGNAKRHEGQPAMTPGEYILCMEKCLLDARTEWYKPDGGKSCLEFVRKVTALGVSCMELHGAPLRVLK